MYQTISVCMSSPTIQERLSKLIAMFSWPIISYSFAMILSLSLSLSFSLPPPPIQLEQIQRGLHMQAHAGLQFSEHLKHLFIAQMRLADILAASSAQNTGKHSCFMFWRQIHQNADKVNNFSQKKAKLC